MITFILLIHTTSVLRTEILFHRLPTTIQRFVPQSKKTTLPQCNSILKKAPMREFPFLNHGLRLNKTSCFKINRERFFKMADFSCSYFCSFCVQPEIRNIAAKNSVQLFICLFLHKKPNYLFYTYTKTILMMKFQYTKNV